jgi:hypothetical protein
MSVAGPMLVKLRVGAERRLWVPARELACSWARRRRGWSLRVASRSVPVGVNPVLSGQVRVKVGNVLGDAVEPESIEQTRQVLGKRLALGQNGKQ